MLRVSRQSIDVLGQKSSDLRVATQSVDVVGTTDPYIRVYRLAVEYLRTVPTGSEIHEVGAASSLSFLQDTSTNIKAPSVNASLSFTQEAAYELIEASRATDTLSLSQTATASRVRSVAAEAYLAFGSETSYVGPKSAHATSLLAFAGETRFPQEHELFEQSLLSIEQTATPGGTRRLAAESVLGIDSIADNIVKLRAANTQIAFTQDTAVEKIITVESRLDIFQEVVLGAVSAEAENHLDLLQTARHEPFPQSAVSQLEIGQHVHQNIRNLSASSLLDIGQSGSVQKPIRVEAVSQLSQQEWLSDGSGSVSLQDIGLRQECLVTHIGCLDVKCIISFNQVADPMLIRADGTDVSASSTIDFSQEARFVETGTGETVLAIDQQADVLAGRPGDSPLEIAHEAVVNIYKGVSAASQVEIRQAATYTHNESGAINQYSPFIGESTDPYAPTPPAKEIDGPMPGIQVPLQLVYPSVGTVTDSVSLRAPNLGNLDRLSFNRVQRETRGGTLVVFADPIWPKVQTLVLSFSGLKRVETQTFLAFLKAYLGQEIGLIDWEHRYWRGVIITPDQPVVENAFDSYSASFEFQGELDPSWNPQVVPPSLRYSAIRSEQQGGYYVPNEPQLPATPETGYLTAEADDTVKIGCPIYMKANGHLGLAQANAAASSNVIGLSLSDTTAGFACKYITEGSLERSDWTEITGIATLTPGGAYYLSASSPGRLTSTPPAAAGQYVVRVGRATSTTKLDIEIEPPILL